MTRQAGDPGNADARTRPIARALALAGIIGPIWFTVSVVVQGLLQPDYSHMTLPISALAAWPAGWMQNLTFYVTGSLTAAFALAIDSAVEPTRRGQTGVPWLLIGSVGLIGAGVFPWVRVDGVLIEPWPHVVSAVMTFVATGIGLIVLSRRLSGDGHWRGLAAYTRDSGIVMLVLFILVGFFAIAPGTPLHPWAGLIQRILCAVWFAWMITLAVKIRLDHRTVALGLR